MRFAGKIKRVLIIFFVLLLGVFPFSACEKEEVVYPKYDLQYKITYYAVFDGELTEIPQDAWDIGKSYPKAHIYGENTIIDDLKSEYAVPRYGYNFSVFFEGWYLDQECTQEYEGIYRYARYETVLYAKLTSNIVYFERSISYQAVHNGKVFDVPDEMFNPKIEYPATYLEWKSVFAFDDLQKSAYYKPNGEKEYYGFYGWYLDENCTQPIAGITQETCGDITVYAKLISEHAIEYKAVTYDNVLKDYTVFDVPKGMWKSGGDYPVSYLNSESDIHVDVLTKGVYYLADGSSGYYHFEGWYLDEDCTQEFNGITQDMYGTITLYAKLKATIAWSPIV